MAKMHLDRLRRKYGYKTGRYQDLMKKIIANNTEAVSRVVGRISNDNYTKALKKIRKPEQRFVLPDIDEWYPKRSVFTRKGAERGVLLTDTLKTELDKQLRSILTTYEKKRKPVYIIRRGAKAGRVSPEVIKEFENRILKTFTNYTKKARKGYAGKIGIPSNIHTIAVTEVRAAVSDIKDRYNQKLLEKNPEKLRMYKRWIHNKSLSIEARPHHEQMDGRTKPGSEPFAVRRKVKKKGRWVQIGWTRMMRPHDNNAPADQVINCNCDVDYFMRLA